MYLKMMSGENKADSNTSKQYTIIPVLEHEYVEMQRLESGKPKIIIRSRGSVTGMEFNPEGNSYLIDKGKTIAIYAYSIH